jgi:hypothetical protein
MTREEKQRIKIVKRRVRLVDIAVQTRPLTAVA